MNKNTELESHNANSEPSIKGELGFFPWHFVHFSLPYRKSETPVWERINGSMSMLMSAGVFKDHNGENINILPYGKYARLALLYLCTEAKRTGSTRVELSRTYRGFMKDLGLKWDSREAREAVKQLRALLSMQVMFTNTEELEGNREHLVSCSFKIGTREDIVFEQDGALDERVSYFLLSDEFYNNVVANFSVPLEYKIWSELVQSTKSPMALDIYLWLNSRARIGRKYSHAPVTWEQLHKQFGSDAAMQPFKAKFRRALEDVLEVAPKYRPCIQEVGNGRGVSKGAKGFKIAPLPPKAIQE